MAPLDFVQDNEALSGAVGTVRGLHFQRPPTAQGKLVRASRGKIFDVAVDIRRGSPSFGKHVSAVLDAEAGDQLWVPPGFLHGFCTLTDDTEVQYKCTDVWNKDAERAVIWNDKAIGITWPIAEEEALLSDKDKLAPPFSEAHGWFQL